MAMDRTVCQIGKIARHAIAQNSIQRQLILTNKRKGAVVLMPISAKCKNFAEGYHKNAKFLVRILIDCCMSASYSLDANASRGRAGTFFYICTDDR